MSPPSHIGKSPGGEGRAEEGSAASRRNLFDYDDNFCHRIAMRSTKPTLAPYRQSLAGTLLAAREAVMAPIRPMLRDADVTEQQWRVLRVLAEHDTLDARSIASAALLHAPSVTRILKELTDRRLIERSIDPKDSRRSIVSISAAGRTLLKLTARHTVQVLKGYADSFGAERLAALQQELTAFIGAVAKFAPRE